MPEVMGRSDPCLGMLWQNLLGNAIKFRCAETVPR